MKLQWNKMNKDTRDALGLFSVTVWELEDKKAQFSARLKNLNGILSSTIADLEKIASGDSKGVIKSESDLLADKVKFEADIAEAKKIERALEDEIRDRLKKGYALVPASLHNAYINRLEDSDAYDNAIGAWLDSVGVAQTPAGIRILGATVGDKEVHGKKVVKNAAGMGLDTLKFDAYARMFLKGVCRDMIKAGVLKTDAYKFEFVIETKNS